MFESISLDSVSAITSLALPLHILFLGIEVWEFVYPIREKN